MKARWISLGKIARSSIEGVIRNSNYLSFNSNISPILVYSVRFFVFEFQLLKLSYSICIEDSWLCIIQPYIERSKMAVTKPLRKSVVLIGAGTQGRRLAYMVREFTCYQSGY